MAGDYLSPEGRRRRELILQMALRDMRSTRRRRWILPGAGVTLAMGLVVMMSLPKPAKHATLAMKSAPSVVSSPVVVQVPMPERQIVAQEILPQPSLVPAVEFVATDPTIADRLTLKPSEPRWAMVDDDQFVQELADAGKPMGLAYVNGNAILLGGEGANR
jgi:hypothetical protein